MIQLAYHNCSYAISFRNCSCFATFQRVVIFINMVKALGQSIYYAASQLQPPGNVPYLPESFLGMIQDQEFCCRQAGRQRGGSGASKS